MILNLPVEFNRPYWTRGSMAPIFESCFIFPLYSLFFRLFFVAYCSFVETNQAVFVVVVFVVALLALVPLVLVLAVDSEMPDRPVKPSCDL